MSEKDVDVLIVGGGVIGLAIAREVARSGMSVRLLERGATGGEATGASAGMLAAQLEAHEPGPLLSLSLASRALYPDFLRALQGETGETVDLRREGALVVALDEAEREALARSASAQRRMGLDVKTLDAVEIRELEPLVSGDAHGGMHLPHEHTVDPRRLVEVLRRAAEAAGAEVRAGVEATCILMERGTARGARAADGTEHRARETVVAAGAWAGALPAEGIPVPPSEPVRGQMLCFAAPGIVRHVVASEEVYLVPRSDGRLLAGSTMERAGFDRSVTAEGMARIAAAAIRLVPRLAAAAFHSAWAGLRPGTPDGLPVLGRAAPGLLYACGHLRNGIVLTPLTAAIVARILRGEAPGTDLSPFDPRRFGPRV